MMVSFCLLYNIYENQYAHERKKIYGALDQHHVIAHNEKNDFTAGSFYG